MSWLSNLTPPGIKNIFKKEDDGASTLWVKCGGCGDMLFHRDLEASLRVCPSCGHHMKMSAEERLQFIFDDGKFEGVALPERVAERKYTDRLKDARKKTGQTDAMRLATGEIGGVSAIVLVQNFEFMGGSMGMALGEAILKAAETAIEKKSPLILFTASGGARMQEGILSLMQMPRSTIAVQMMHEAKLPYVVVLTNPTTGGVTASYAMLGDVHLAEPGALIAFAGPRVIEQTIREKLPEGFQRSEFQLDHGMVDMVTPRAEMKETLSRLLRVLVKSPAQRVASAGKPASAVATAAVVPIASQKSVTAKSASSLDKAAE